MTYETYQSVYVTFLGRSTRTSHSRLSYNVIRINRRNYHGICALFQNVYPQMSVFEGEKNPLWISFITKRPMLLT